MNRRSKSAPLMEYSAKARPMKKVGVMLNNTEVDIWVET